MLTCVHARARWLSRLVDGPRQTVFALMGRTAVGKSTLGRALGELPGFAYISQSECKTRVRPVFSDADNLDEDLRDEGYRLAIRDAMHFVEEGRIPVVDASWHRVRRRKWLYRACDEAGTKLILVYLRCDNFAEIQRRLDLRAKRKDGVDDLASTLDVHHHIDRELEEPKEVEWGGGRVHMGGLASSTAACACAAGDSSRGLIDRLSAPPAGVTSPPKSDFMRVQHDRPTRCRSTVRRVIEM